MHADQDSNRPMDKFKGKGLLKMLASPRGRSAGSSSSNFAASSSKDAADVEPSPKDIESKPTPSNSKIWGKLWGSRRSSESPKCSPGSPKAAPVSDDTLALRITPVKTRAAASEGVRDDTSDMADNESWYSTPMRGTSSPNGSPMTSNLEQTLVLNQGSLPYDDGATPLGQKQGMADVLTPGFLATLGEAPGSPTTDYEDADVDMMTVALVPADKLAAVPGLHQAPDQELLSAPGAAAGVATDSRAHGAAAVASEGVDAIDVDEPAGAVEEHHMLPGTVAGHRSPSPATRGGAAAGVAAASVDAGDVQLAVEEPGSAVAASRARASPVPPAAGPGLLAGARSATRTPSPAALSAVLPRARAGTPTPAEPASAAMVVDQVGKAPSTGGRRSATRSPSPVVASASSAGPSAGGSPSGSAGLPEAAARAASHMLEDVRSSAAPSPAVEGEASWPELGCERVVLQQEPAAQQEAQGHAQLAAQAVEASASAAAARAASASPAAGGRSGSGSGRTSPADSAADGLAGPQQAPFGSPTPADSPVSLAREAAGSPACSTAGVSPVPTTGSTSGATATARSPTAGADAPQSVAAAVVQATPGSARSAAGSPEPSAAAGAAADMEVVQKVAAPEAGEPAGATAEAPEADSSAGVVDETAAAAAPAYIAADATASASVAQLASQESLEPAAEAAAAEEGNETVEVVLPAELSTASSSLVMQASLPGEPAAEESGLLSAEGSGLLGGSLASDDDLLARPCPSEEPDFATLGSLHGPRRGPSPAGSSKFTPVRESLPLFATSAMRESQMVSSSLLEEDERLLELGGTGEPGELTEEEAAAAAAAGAGSAGKAPGSGGRGGAAAGAGAKGNVWGRLSRGLQGGPQRVAAGGGHAQGGQFVSSLAPVQEMGSPEADSMSPAGAKVRGCPMSPVREDGAVTPLQPRSLDEGLQQAEQSPGELSLRGSPLGAGRNSPVAGRGSAAAVLATPPAAGNMHEVDLLPAGRASPQYGGAAFTPTMALNTGLAGGADTAQALMGGIGASAALGGALTPSLLDSTEASPSLVYAGGRFMATPLRNQLDALPLDAARHVPLIDSSPLSLGGEDNTISLEAQRALYHLEQGGSAPVMTPAAGGMGMNSDVYQQTLIKKLAEAEEALKNLQFDNEKLREQLCTLEFQKDEMSNQDEFEREAREFAESQLVSAQAEMGRLHAARAEDQAEVARLQELVKVVQAEAEARVQGKDNEQLVLQEQLVQVRADYAAASDRLQSMEVQLMNAMTETKGMRAELEQLQQERAHLMACVESREKDVADLLRDQQQQKVQLEKAMEQLIAAQTAKEHAVRKGSEDRQRMSRTEAALQQALASQEAYKAELQTLRQKYAIKSQKLEEAAAQVQAQQAEIAEVMGMCDTLLSEREKLKAMHANATST